MGIIKYEDIRGYRTDSGIVCCECVGDERLKDITEDEVVTENEVEGGFDDLWFCDDCKKRL